MNQILFTPRGCKVPPDSILGLMEPHREKLQNRHGASVNNNWFNLRSCNYYSQMMHPKIIFPDISNGPKFCMDFNGSLILDGSYFIDTDDFALLGILNSSIAWSYFITNCSSIGNAENKGRLRLKKYFVEQFPIPRNFNVQSKTKTKIMDVVKRIIDEGQTNDRMEELNNAVCGLYRASS